MTARRWFVICLVLFLIGIPSVSIGQETPNLQNAARRLLESVVTVRVAVPASKSDSKKDRVVVCSGAVVGDKWIVTSVFAGSDSEIRLTLPGGRQERGKVRVLDEHSGLALIEMPQAKIPAIPLAEKLPPVGDWVVSAAAWGIEKPVVSLGVVSGHNRTDPGLNFPPLLLCDLRTASTSSGAAILNQGGELIGVVVVSEHGRRHGWTYAVPVSHVSRLIRTAETSKPKDSLVILKRRRPEVGMVLDGQPDNVRVARVHDQSPASRAGIQVGDRVTAVESLQIRSVYQAIRPVLVKQPGDTVTFTIERDGKSEDVQVVLGGGVVITGARLADLSRFIQPKVDVTASDLKTAQKTTAGHLQEVAATEEDLNHATADATRELLEKSLRRYQLVLRVLQDKLLQSEAERKKLKQQIEELREDLQSFKKDAAR